MIISLHLVFYHFCKFCLEKLILSDGIDVWCNNVKMILSAPDFQWMDEIWESFSTKDDLLIM